MYQCLCQHQLFTWLFFSFSGFFYIQDFSPCSFVRNKSLSLLISQTFCPYEFRWNSTLPPVLKVYPCVSSSLCRYFCPVALVGELDLNWMVGHIFPYWELTAITLVWGRAGNWVARARVRARCEPGLSLMISGWSHPISGEVGSQGSRAETLMVRLKLVPFLLSVCSPGSQYQNLCHTERIVLEQLGIVHVPSVGQSVCWDGPSTLFIPICYFCASNSYPCPY